VSSVSTHDVTAAWPAPRAAGVPLLLSRARDRDVGAGDRDAGVELGFRIAAVQVGYRLGWAAIGIVLAGLALDAGARQRLLLVALTLAAAAGNALATVVPWREWLPTRRGRALLDLWCGGLIVFVALLVIDASSSFALLLFLAAPFIAVVQIGRRRVFWLAVATATCSLVAALVPLSPGATALRLALIAASVVVVLLLARAIRREAAAHMRAAVRAELERTLAQEANHRIKNDLQTAADLLLLGRPNGRDAAAFDETAARIRTIATVHRLLTEPGGRVDALALLHAITADVAVPVTVDAEPAAFDATTAQRVGLVANELVTNAFRHGAPPIVVRLRSGASTQLTVEDNGELTGGYASGGRATGLGLDLVRRLVERGLDGRFELRTLAAGGTHAEVVFPTVSR
jgi:two-component sensor histidine kinase